MSDFTDRLRECRDCGLVQSLPELQNGEVALCCRCGSMLREGGNAALSLAAASAVAGLALLAIAVHAPLASVTMQGGRFATASAWSMPESLGDAHRWGLAAVVVATLFVLPALRFVGVLGIGVSRMLRSPPSLLFWLFGRLDALRKWSMIDVFLLGATVALIRLNAWMRVDVHTGLLALAAAALCSLALDRSLDRTHWWPALANMSHPRSSPLSQPLECTRSVFGCAQCGLVSRGVDGDRCPRCRFVLERRKRDSTSRSWALLGAAAFLLLPANLLPVITISQLGQGGASTIIGGTVELVEAGFWSLGVLVFVASVIIPLLKILVLGALLLLTACRSGRWLRLRARLYRGIDVVGRWSMLDVFAAAVLVALARFAWVGSVVPNAGLAAFGAVVAATMLATEAFDPRLMWDAAGENSKIAVERSETTRVAP